MTSPFISIVIPTYNEEKSIGSVLDAVYRALEKNRWVWEVIVIEDGSKDGTRRVVEQKVKEHPYSRAIYHEVNKGYCQSLKDGLREAKGKYSIYVAGDEEFDCLELPQFMEKLESGADLVLGVRWQRNDYALWRLLISVIYIFLLNFLFKVRVNDYNWIQAWPTELFTRIELESKSLFILPEIIIKAHDLGYRIAEIPSNHKGRPFGQSSLNYRIMGYAILEAFRFAFSGRQTFQRKYADRSHSQTNLSQVSAK